VPTALRSPGSASIAARRLVVGRSALAAAGRLEHIEVTVAQLAEARSAAGPTEDQVVRAGASPEGEASARATLVVPPGDGSGGARDSVRAAAGAAAARLIAAGDPPDDDRAGPAQVGLPANRPRPRLRQLKTLAGRLTPPWVTPQPEREPLPGRITRPSEPLTASTPIHALLQDRGY
jgi:hypothetical protein